MQDDFDRDFYYNSNKTDILAVVVALIATIFIHVGAYYVVPQEFAKFGEEQKKYDDLKIEVLPPKIEKRMPDFIEANPYANNDKPISKDAPESFKDQRASDELPDPTSKSKKPFVEGEIKDGKKIVSGTSAERDELSPQKVFETLERPLEQPAQPTQTSAQQTAQTEQKTQSSKSEGDQQKHSQTEKQSQQKSVGQSDKESAPKKSDKPQDTAPDDKQGFIKIEKKKEIDSAEAKEYGAIEQKKESSAVQNKINQTSNSKNKSENANEEIAKQGDVQSQQETQKHQEQKPEEKPAEESLPAPRPRPMLSMKIPAGPLADNRTHASNQGVVACDSRFSEFGAYQQRMLEAISRQWNLLASKYDLGTAVGTMVIIEYYLNSMGELSKFKILHTTSTNTGTGLCEQSILTTAPYGEWTQEMVNTFGGQDQSVRITFHYR